jgi:hypothetical protein
LKNVQFWSRSRKAKISTTGIYVIFRGLKFEPDVEIEQKGAFLKVSLFLKILRRFMASIHISKDPPDKTPFSLGLKSLYGLGGISWGCGDI